MAGTFTQKQAESYWNRYNKDGNSVLTVDEVKECIKEAFGVVEEGDVEEKFAFFGQKEVKDLTKEQFLEGMVMADKCTELEKTFKKMDKDNNSTLSKQELVEGLKQNEFPEDQAKFIVEEFAYDEDQQYNIKEFVETVRFSEYFKQAYGF